MPTPQANTGAHKGTPVGSGKSHEDKKRNQGEKKCAQRTPQTTGPHYPGVKARKGYPGVEESCGSEVGCYLRLQTIYASCDL